ADVLTDPLPPAPLWLANLELHLLEPLLRRPDVPPRVLVSGLLAGQTVGGGERVGVDGWAAELVERGPATSTASSRARCAAASPSAGARCAGGRYLRGRRRRPGAPGTRHRRRAGAARGGS